MKWDLILNTGYIFEFENRKGDVVIKVYGRSEEEAWKKLKEVVK